MKPIAAAIATATLSVLCIFGGNIAPAAADDDHSQGTQLNPCAVPNEIVGSVEETAWQIWVAATCPVNKDQYPFVVWENWIEQAQLYPPDPSQGLKVPNSGAATTQHPLHGSPLALTFHPESATSGSARFGRALPTPTAMQPMLRLRITPLLTATTR